LVNLNRIAELLLSLESNKLKAFEILINMTDIEILESHQDELDEKYDEGYDDGYINGQDYHE
jgi:hypothetical protein